MKKVPVQDHSYRESLGSCILGFFLSIVLTIGANIIVDKTLLTGSKLIVVLLGMAVLQAFIQLILFLHLGREGKPHSNLTVFLFMLLVLLIIVLGSLWIMSNLNYNEMRLD